MSTVLGGFSSLGCLLDRGLLSAVRFVNSYPLDSDLSVGLYTTLDPGVNSSTYPAGISAHHISGLPQEIKYKRGFDWLR